MRLNKYIALHTIHSRRAADILTAQERVTVNSQQAKAGQDVADNDIVQIDGQDISKSNSKELTTIMFNKPRGYVCSRQGQGSKTIYDILPTEFKHLNSVGRLDKDSSGLLLMTNDGDLANRLTHPSYQKQKVYYISLNKPLQANDKQTITDKGVQLDDGLSKLGLETLDDSKKNLRVSMSEGRNRQIRRTFLALGYGLTELHRTDFADYNLEDLKSGQVKIV